eukprot:8478325-Pyramimonas_sp.AAC.1
MHQMPLAIEGDAADRPPIEGDGHDSDAMGSIESDRGGHGGATTPIGGTATPIGGTATPDGMPGTPQPEPEPSGPAPSTSPPP